MANEYGNDALRGAMQANQNRLDATIAKSSQKPAWITQMKAALTPTYKTAPKTGNATVDARNAVTASQNYASSVKSANTKKAAIDFWDSQRIAQNEANADTLRDRQAMLAEIAEFKATSLVNEERMSMLLGQTEDRLNAKTETTMRDIQIQIASMGRVMNPMLMGDIRAKLELQNQDTLNTQRASLEMERAKVHQSYLSQLSSVLADTQRNVMSPAEAMQMMQALGASNDNTQAFQSGGGGSGGSGGYSSGGGSRVTSVRIGNMSGTRGSHSASANKPRQSSRNSISSSMWNSSTFGKSPLRTDVNKSMSRLYGTRSSGAFKPSQYGGNQYSVVKNNQSGYVGGTRNSVNNSSVNRTSKSIFGW